MEYKEGLRKNEKNNIINLGEDFKVKKGLRCDYLKEYKTLYQCYNKPSYSKEKIYNYYFDLLKNNSDDILRYGVRSYNTFMITLHGEIIKDNKTYYVMITPSYNYIEEI